MRPADIAPTLKALSPIRLGNYFSYFNAVDDFDLYACYQWNGEVSRSLLPLIHLVEVTLRNAYHRELSRYHSGVRLGRPQDSFDWYNHVRLSPHSQRAIAKVLRTRTRPDDVISKQTFGFWTNIFSESTTPWATVLKDVYPNATRNLAHSSNRDKVEARKQLINDLRNRIAHWEPIWKLPDLMEERILRPRAAPIRLVKPAPTNPEQSIERLRLIHDRMISLLDTVDPLLAHNYQDSYTYEHFMWVCSEGGLVSFRASQRRQELSLTVAKRDLARIMRGNAIVTVTNGRQLMRIHPLGRQ
ncbi:Abi family protein [Pseudomonas graminis]|uniref:Abi family protein n=1 Tax=Pseudomonas graminis TaxID=158627 RepID=UPI002349C4E5|nr:Abi family protein [Pseudomonas graminis]MDC6379927.1 Abi family protein [Pseudomonas graminis]